MSKRFLIFLLGMALVIVMAACGTTTEEGDASGTTSAGSSTESADVVAGVPAARLNDDYDDALSVSAQLAIGTVQLEETEMAVTQAQAADLLPLWRALQSLVGSDTTAQAELDAVIKQIQDTMSPEQVQAVSDMGLTQEGLTQMIQNGELLVGGFGARARQAGDNAEGLPGGGPDAFFGPGGGPGGGAGRGFAGGGFAGGSPGGLSEDDLATRQAQFAEGDFSGLQEQAMIRAAVRLMETKTGEAPAQGPGNLVNTVFTVVSEATGVSLETLQEQVAEGATLTQIVENNGGDVEALRADLIEALEALPNAADFDADQLAKDWLGAGR